MGKEQSAEYYNSIYAASARYSNHYSAMPYLATWALVMQLIKEHARLTRTNRPHILDIGCGTGQFAHFLNDHVPCQYLGIDFSEKAIAIARDREDTFASDAIFSFLRFNLSGISDFGPPLDADIYTALETLEHIENDIAVITAIPYGRLVIITVPSFDDEGHVRHFTKPEEVSRRYGPLIGTVESPATVERIRSWFILYGIRNRTIQTGVTL